MPQATNGTAKRNMEQPKIERVLRLMKMMTGNTIAQLKIAGVM